MMVRLVRAILSGMKKLQGLGLLAIVAVIFIVLVVVLVAMVGRGFRHSDGPDERLVFDRVWIDHLPENDRDTVNVFAVLEDQRIGIFQAASQWKQMVELFQTTDKGGGGLGIVYPQTREREVITAHAVPCKKGVFDYCLELRGASRGVKEYGSKKGWEIDRKADLARLRTPRQ